MDLLLLGRAIALGFTIAAAVGPISLLTIRRTLTHGRLYGLASGLGVASADATYAAIAAFGLTAITTVFVGSRGLLGLAGGLILAYLGMRTLTTRPAEVNAASDRPGLPAAFVSIYGLTMTNPMTIVSFVGLFAALGLAGRAGGEAATLVAGVFVGSALWWLVLTWVVSWLRGRVSPRALTWVNRASGAILIAIAAASIAGALLG